MATKRRTKPRTNPAFRNAAAALAGGAGGALIGGLLVRSGIAPTTAAIGISVAGAVGAVTTKGSTRLAAGGAAAAGAGQLALAWLAKQPVRAPSLAKRNAELPAAAGGVMDAFDAARRQLALEDDGDRFGSDSFDAGYDSHADYADMDLPGAIVA